MSSDLVRRTRKGASRMHVHRNAHGVNRLVEMVRGTFVDVDAFVVM